MSPISKKILLLIIALVAITYGNSLLNDFVGDDHMLFVESDFFKSWDHFAQLFTPAAVTDVNDLFLNDEGRPRSRVVSYRPVVMATYFPEYQLWRLNPFGYHLNNLLIHIANSILVFFLVGHIVRHKKTALLSALLFSVHPINAEAVCNIGRADILAGFFSLGSLFCFMKYPQTSGRRRKVVCGTSLVSFFLAVFTKESAIVLPGVMMAYDFFIGRSSGKTILVRFKSRYLGYLLISSFYIYIYFFVFPNPLVKRVSFLGGGVLTHLATMIHIVVEYITAFLWPFSIGILPPMYTPSVKPLWSHENVWAVSLLLLVLLLAKRQLSHRVPLSFFISWLALALLPVSNIIPLANPMAYRFMYFPSVGFFTILAIGFEQFFGVDRYPGIKMILKCAVIATCILLTIFLNSRWQNNYTMAKTILKSYPDSSKAYHLLAYYFQKRGEYKQARAQLKKALTIEPENPVFYHDLGALYTNDPQKAIENFKMAIKLYPAYKRASTDLCRAYANQGDYQGALTCFEQRIQDGEVAVRTYIDYIRLCLLAQETEMGQKVCGQALSQYPTNEELLTMKRLVAGGD